MFATLGGEHTTANNSFRQAGVAREQIALLPWPGRACSLLIVANKLSKTEFATYGGELSLFRHHGCRTSVFASMTGEHAALIHRIRKYFPILHVLENNSPFLHDLKKYSKKHAPPHLSHCSRFEILAACLWRCRTIALQPNPDEEVRIICIVNARSCFKPPIPKGYYGNCIAYSVAKARAEDLSRNPIGYALELVRRAKANVTEEYMRSVADLMVLKGRPRYTMVGSFLVSGVARARFDEVDFGWGRAVYGGPAKGHVASFHIATKNKKGEDGIVVTLCLPKVAMERFVKELDQLLKDQPLSAL